MEDWRAKAVEYFPELRELIEQESSPLSLWIELYHVLVDAYDEQPINEELIGKVYDYASWCFKQPETGNIETDPANGVAVSFMEDIPLNRRISDDLYRWVSSETFDGCEPLLRYVLNDEEFQRFATDFHRKKKLYSGPSRL